MSGEDGNRLGRVCIVANFPVFPGAPHSGPGTGSALDNCVEVTVGYLASITCYH